MIKVDNLDINWEQFNAMLDEMEYTVIFPGDQDQQLNKPSTAYDRVQGRYNKHNCLRHEYVSEDFYDMIPESFLHKHNLDSNNVVIKVLEHPPGTFSFPHTDTYEFIRRKFSLDPQDKVKRLWIPCTDYRFGHAFFADKKVISNYNAGDTFEVPAQTLHSAANAGVEIRRVMTITGKEKK